MSSRLPVSYQSLQIVCTLLPKPTSMNPYFKTQKKNLECISSFYRHVLCLIVWPMSKLSKMNERQKKGRFFFKRCLEKFCLSVKSKGRVPLGLFHRSFYRVVAPYHFPLFYANIYCIKLKAAWRTCCAIDSSKKKKMPVDLTT